MANLRSVVKIGAHRVLLTPSGGTEIDMGFTKEGSVITRKATTYERVVEELAAPYDARISAWEILAKTILVDTDLDKVAAALSSLKTVSADPVATSVDIDPAAGRSVAFGTLIFRPRDLTAADKSQDKTFWNALQMPDSELPLKANEDQTLILNCKAGAYWDSTASKWKIYTEGDPATAVTFAV